MPSSAASPYGSAPPSPAGAPNKTRPSRPLSLDPSRNNRHEHLPPAGHAQPTPLSERPRTPGADDAVPPASTHTETEQGGDLDSRRAPNDTPASTPGRPVTAGSDPAAELNDAEEQDRGGIRPAIEHAPAAAVVRSGFQLEPGQHASRTSTAPGIRPSSRARSAHGRGRQRARPGPARRPPTARDDRPHPGGRDLHLTAEHSDRARASKYRHGDRRTHPTPPRARLRPSAARAPAGLLDRFPAGRARPVRGTSTENTAGVGCHVIR
jgi:hypothetical protein